MKINFSHLLDATMRARARVCVCGRARMRACVLYFWRLKRHKYLRAFITEDNLYVSTLQPVVIIRITRFKIRVPELSYTVHFYVCCDS